MRTSIILCLLLCYMSMLAQNTKPTTEEYVVTCHNNFEYIGEIIEDDGREILMKTDALGTIYIPKIEVKSIVKLETEKHIVYNAYQPEGPFTTRYTFTTNALPIKKGENYGMINLYGPEAHVAVSDNLNIGIMSSWIASPLVLALKYSFNTKNEKVHYSLGSLLGTSGYLNGFKGYGGLHWFNMTLGDRKNNITFSAGYAYLQTGVLSDEPAPGFYSYSAYAEASDRTEELLKLSHGPIFSIAGIAKIGARSSFVFDAMLGSFSHEKRDIKDAVVNNQHGYIVSHQANARSAALFIMPGVRFQSTERKAFQISVSGITLLGDTDLSFPIPMCTWFYKF